MAESALRLRSKSVPLFMKTDCLETANTWAEALVWWPVRNVDLPHL